MNKLISFTMLLFVALACDKHEEPLPPDVLVDPTLSLQVVSILKDAATLKSTVTPGSYTIEGTGICYDMSNNNPTIQNKMVYGSGDINLVNLTPGVKYYARSFALTTQKVFYGSTIEFTTNDIVAFVQVSEVDFRTAKVTMSVDEEVSNISERGIVYSFENQTPTTSDTKVKGEVVNLELLDYETKYYVRAYVIISDRTIYSQVADFKTKELQRVTDYDGNVYRVIEMPSTKGPRLWLLDNFKGTHYANGDPIPNVTDDIEWTKLESGAYCYYDNNKEHAKTYGALYNYWVAVDPRGLIPGWHTPSDKEWLEMSEEVGGGKWMGPIIGGKLKQAGTSHWQAPNTGATNETGFTALPAGVRPDHNGKFVSMRTFAILASSTPISDAFWSKKLYYDRNEFHETGAGHKANGVSIRLIKTN